MKKICLLLLIGLVFVGCSAKGSLNYTPPATPPVSIKAATTRHSVAEVLAAAAAYAKDNFYTLEPATAKKSVIFSFETNEQLKYIDCGILVSHLTAKSGRKHDCTTPAAAERYNLKYMEGREYFDENRTHKLRCTVTVTPRPAGELTAVDISVRYDLEGQYERNVYQYYHKKSWPYRVTFTSQSPSVKPPDRYQCQTNGTLEKDIFKGIMAMIPKNRK